MDYRDSRIGFLNDESRSRFASGSASVAEAMGSSESKVDAYKMVLSGRWSRADFDSWVCDVKAKAAS